VIVPATDQNATPDWPFTLPAGGQAARNMNVGLTATSRFRPRHHTILETLAGAAGYYHTCAKHREPDQALAG
jgi:hypothetical protein